MLTVLTFLGIQGFAKDKDGKVLLSEEQQKKMKENFGEDFTGKFVHAISNDPDGNSTDGTHVQEMITAMNAKLQQALSAQASAQAELDSMRVKSKHDLEAIKAENTRLTGVVTEKEGIIATLTNKPEDDPPAKDVNMSTKKWTPTGQDTHLFGAKESFFALDDRHGYNQRAYAALCARNGLRIISPEATSSLDYQALTDDLGSYYRIRKQDRIQSFLQQLPSLTSIFQLESGYQDQAVLVNMFLTEFSQADNTSSAFDNIVKGGYTFEPEIISMYDAMFAHKFTDLKNLEKSWIGYLNREGSSTMKWSFIEFIMVETAKQLKNEQEQRWIHGIRVNPTLNVPGTSMGASNGLLKFIKNQIAAFKVKPFSLGEFTDSTIAQHLYDGTKLIPAVLRDSGKIVCYMAPDVFSSYCKNLETLYGLNQDYSPNTGYVKEFPSVKIIQVPNMGVSKRIIWTIEGNIVLLEDKPGEMLNFNFEQQDWSLKVWSNWKESVWAYMVGKKYASAAELPDDYSTQMVFCNDVDEPASYFLPMTVDDTTPSVLNHTSLVSVANTKATAITDIDDCAVGQEVILKCGSATNAITIAASGKFSLLTAAWTPEVGDTLTLKKRSDGKFIELNRSTATSDAIAFDADDTTPSVADGTEFITDANSKATAITSLDDATTGVVYTINGAGTTNASTIANSGNFVLTGAMTLEAGTWIKLQKSAVDGKFYEISRSV